MHVGKIIARIRIQKGLRQRQIAEQIHISQTAFSRIEHGVIRPRQKTIEKIAVALDMPVACLYILALEKQDIPVHNQHLFDTYFPQLVDIVFQLTQKANTSAQQ